MQITVKLLQQWLRKWLWSKVQSIFFFFFFLHSHLFLIVTVGLELESGTAVDCLGNWGRDKKSRKKNIYKITWWFQINYYHKTTVLILSHCEVSLRGHHTFIFTLAHTGRLSLQPLWTEELQSRQKRKRKSRAQSKPWLWWQGWGCLGFVERWRLEILTGFHSWPGKSTSPLMKARLELRMWCNQEVILLMDEGGGAGSDTPVYMLHGNMSIM